MLCKVKEVENTYVFFWFSRTRDNSICKFTTEDSIEDIIKEFNGWLDNKLEFKEDMLDSYIEGYELVSDNGIWNKQNCKWVQKNKIKGVRK